ncbi:glycine cleavage system protein GcvH [candidate division KSB1 bacterium]|nr:glycine cleavage system protein GcvH [candidate division KSB1 bacterium]NIR72577.1 glycine cleavage system protein GcvH [candidate division KSB1 bacterium]NIS27329.1 glycine cleavage system protein GcvH [candidate division KSB1 bacterium]NIT74185.1 glycine cleavage system protein GcvH [candidate division KSB1 bacterium]NIU27411.1 glycine cleavage system protein GcvH [candidate division KSB1 bacterium]
MEVPEDLLYTSEHEWVSMDGDVATVGITDYAQGELGDIVFVELPNVGDSTTQMQPFGTIEAVKAVSDLYAPLTGEIVEVNTDLEEKPEQINSEPYGTGWLIKIKIKEKTEVDKLLSPEDYRSQVM